MEGGQNMLLRRSIVAVGVWTATAGISAQAQFGLKCDSPSFESALAGTKPTADIEAAVRATCAFNKKNAEIRQTFGTGGWAWDLLPKARSDVTELTELADRAATLNFATKDPRALGNIRNMYLRVGDQKRWLSGEESKFARRQQAMAASTSGDHASSVSSQSPDSETFVLVVFQDDVTAADKTSFLSAYDAAVVDGPDQNGAYKLKLNAPPPQDQLQLVLDSMKSQEKVVKAASAR